MYLYGSVTPSRQNGQVPSASAMHAALLTLLSCMQIAEVEEAYDEALHGKDLLAQEVEELHEEIR